MKILHLNIRSLLAHWEEIKATILDECLDIVMFTETWLHENCENNLFAADGLKNV